MPRTEIFTDGCRSDHGGGWAAVMLRTSSGRQPTGTSNDMELRALLEAVKMADGPTTIISDLHGIVRTAQQRKVPEWSRALWEELYAAAEGKDISFEWRKRSQTIGQQIAHRLAKEAAMSV